MPTYDLSCERCGHAFEVFRPGFLRDADRACPSCGSAQVEQLFTGFVTSRPPRDRPEPRVTGYGHACGPGCGCARARVSPSGEVIPP